jgi:hypothetical protein
MFRAHSTCKKNASNKQMDLDSLLLELVQVIIILIGYQCINQSQKLSSDNVTFALYAGKVCENILWDWNFYCRLLNCIHELIEQHIDVNS